MKNRKFPYDIEAIKKFIIKKNYLEPVNFTNYKRIIKYIYPELSPYYIRSVMEELTKQKFLITSFINRRRYFKYNKKEDLKDIGFIEF